MKKIKFMTILTVFFLFPFTLCAQNVSDYLILQNISSYKFSTQSINPVTDEVKQIPGYTIINNPGILIGSDHFRLDHKDTTYETDYESDVTDIGVEIKVTQHTGGDSDKWLSHELDAEFRTYYGIPDDSYTMRIINGNNIITFGVAGWVYRWVSNNKVVSIEYHDGQMTKPEPLEVVNAYLTKYPSTLPAVTSAGLRTADNQTTWIKDEIDRRLWLCDKWNAQFKAGGVTQTDLIYNLHRSMGVFLNYRQKYYGVSATADLNLLNTYKKNNDLTSMLAKLTDYKTWWAKHKTDSISVP